MATISLTDIQKAADEKYGPTVIEFDEGSVSLRSPLRMSKDERAQLTKLADEINEDDADQEQMIVEIIRLAASDPRDASDLLRQVDGDLASLMLILQEYLGSSEVGEASASQD